MPHIRIDETEANFVHENPDGLCCSNGVKTIIDNKGDIFFWCPDCKIRWKSKVGAEEPRSTLMR